MKEIIIDDIAIGGENPLVLIAGPCVIEDEKTTRLIAQKIQRIAVQFNIPFIFKASYEKNNRSSSKHYRGPGLEAGMNVLRNIRDELGVPVLSDVHRETDIEAAREVLDVIQIPALLCQQTSLLLKAGETQKCVNVKKGQFMSPEGMKSAIEKIESTGNTRILLTERGSCFGYNRLVADITSIPIMQELGYPVVFDSTHIVRLAGTQSSDPRGGTPRFIGHLTRAGVAAGCDAVFIETHPTPAEAFCDAASMLPLDLLAPLLEQIIPISEIARRPR